MQGKNITDACVPHPVFHRAGPTAYNDRFRKPQRYGTDTPQNAPHYLAPRNWARDVGRHFPHPRGGISFFIGVFRCCWPRLSAWPSVPPRFLGRRPAPPQPQPVAMLALGRCGMTGPSTRLEMVTLAWPWIDRSTPDRFYPTNGEGSGKGTDSHLFYHMYFYALYFLSLLPPNSAMEPVNYGFFACRGNDTAAIDINALPPPLWNRICRSSLVGVWLENISCPQRIEHAERKTIQFARNIPGKWDSAHHPL
ncbi:hypothetical protein FQR65_LT19303 [Abscondita terminalis]|nr:hypothetical protein FQR65_LT19303 [Abscondita terminalis]